MLEVNGFEELTQFVVDSELTHDKLKDTLKRALTTMHKDAKNNAPVDSNKLKKGVRLVIKQDGFATIGIIKTSSFYDIFQEYGTSKQHKHVGWFERAVASNQNKVMKILSNEVLKK